MRSVRPLLPKIYTLSLLVVLTTTILALAVTAHAARPAGPVILLDFSHGENTKGLCTLIATMPEAYWIVLVPQSGFKLPNCPIKPYEIWVGDFSKVADKLRDVDMIIIGQPTKYLSSSEIKTIVEWFKSASGRVLWCAGDSDYPAQGGVNEVADHACDAIFKALGVHIRLDFVSIEDTVSNAGKPYRVVGIVKPDSRYNASIIALGAHRVLFHGPGAVAWVDSSGVWHKLTDPATPKNIIKIVVTTNNGRVVEHQPKAPGAPGEFGKAHHVGETGVFVLMGAEIVNMGGKLPNIVIASGESPYGGYQPMVTYRYHGVPLDGPRFIRNVLLWALHYPAELGALMQLSKILPKTAPTTKTMTTPVATSSPVTVQVTVTGMEKVLSRVASVESQVSQIASKLNSVITDLDNAISVINKMSSTMSGILLVAYIGIAIAVIALVIALLAIALAVKRR